MVSTHFSRHFHAGCLPVSHQIPPAPHGTNFSDGASVRKSSHDGSPRAAARDGHRRRLTAVTAVAQLAIRATLQTGALNQDSNFSMQYEHAVIGPRSALLKLAPQCVYCYQAAAEAHPPAPGLPLVVQTACVVATAANGLEGVAAGNLRW